jgi:hypothetical protein
LTEDRVGEEDACRGRTTTYFSEGFPALVTSVAVPKLPLPRTLTRRYRSMMAAVRFSRTSRQEIRARAGREARMRRATRGKSASCARGSLRSAERGRREVRFVGRNGRRAGARTVVRRPERDGESDVDFSRRRERIFAGVPTRGKLNFQTVYSLHKNRKLPRVLILFSQMLDARFPRRPWRYRYFPGAPPMK